MKQTPLPGGFYYYQDGDQLTESWNQVQAQRQAARWRENRNNLYQVGADIYSDLSLDADGAGQFAMSLQDIVATFFGYHPDAPPVGQHNVSYSDEFNRSYFWKWSFSASYWPAAPAAHSFLRDSYNFRDFLNNTEDWFSINAFPRNLFVFKKGNSSELDTFLGFAPTTSAFVLVVKLALGGETGTTAQSLFLADSNQEFIVHHDITPTSADQGPWYVALCRAQGATTYHTFTSTNGYAWWYLGDQTKAGTITRFGLRLRSASSKRAWATVRFVRVFLGVEHAHTARNLEV